MNAPHPLPSLCRDNPGERIERSVGADYGADGYIARAQADELADLLELRPGQHLLDIGAGSGWPGPYRAAHRLPRRLGGPSPRPAADATGEPGNGDAHGPRIRRRWPCRSERGDESLQGEVDDARG